jgi:DNA (cytosine-5)-methyltransferase 1
MAAYYNENDKKAAAWLRELIKAKAIAPGEVDERSIEEVTPNDLQGFDQCHFFAGIGGWSYALRLAGWPDERPVWTGSCPCQPFSAAGKGLGFADERHLWPAWDWLIGQCHPSVVFGEQVANAFGWLDLVSADLEGKGYAFGAAIVGAHSVGAPHIRQRLYFMAESQSQQRNRNRDAGRRRGGLANSNGLGNAKSNGRIAWRPESGERSVVSAGVMGDSNNKGSQGWGERRDGADQGTAWAADMVDCRDGKRRPIEPGTFPLAHGVPHRVGLLRGYGNAIVPQVAATFIKCYCDLIVNAANDTFLFPTNVGVPMSEASRANALQHAAAIHHGSGDHEATLATAELFHSFITGEGAEAPVKAAKPAAAKPKPAAAKPKPAPVEEAADDDAAGDVTKEQVGESIEGLLNANLRDKAIKLFAKYGAKSLSGVKPEDYAAIKADADDLLLNA